MAIVIDTPNDFVNQSERMVFDHLVNTLSDEFTLISNLNILLQNKAREIDLLVIGPSVIWVVEVKNHTAPVKVGMQKYYVGQDERSHPLFTTRTKAQILSSAIKNLLNVQHGPWFQELVLYASEPPALTIIPEMEAYFRTLDSVAELFENPSSISLHRPIIPSEHKKALLELLDLNQTTRVPYLKLNMWESNELTIAGEWKFWKAKSLITGKPFDLHIRDVQHLRGKECTEAKRQAFYPATMGARVRNSPVFMPPTDRFFDDDDNPGVAFPVYPSLKLLSDHDFGHYSEDESRKFLRDLAIAIEYAHTRKVAFRCLDLTKIAISKSNPGILPSAFKFGCNPDLGASDQHCINPESWIDYLDHNWVAPEHISGEEVSASADIWFIGRIAKTLFETGVPTDLEPIITSCMNADPAQRPLSLASLIDALTPKVEKEIPKRGFVIDNRYELVEMISSDGFIEFWSGIDKANSNKVGLKIFNEDDDTTATYEFAFLNTMDNEGIVKALDIEKIGERPVVVMEWLEGTALSSFVPERGLSPSQVTTFGLQILETLKSIHFVKIRESIYSTETDNVNQEFNQSICAHHNLTPENIIIVNGRGPVLIDFGIYDDEGKPLFAPDPHYSPIGGVTPNNPDADLFALGKILTEMLSSIDEMTELSLILERSQSNNRKNRFISADEFIDALLSLGIGNIDLPPVQPDILELRNEIWDLVRKEEYQGALDLCPENWLALNERIQEIMDALPPRESNALEDIDGYKLSFLKERRGEAEDPKWGTMPDAIIREYVVKGPQGQLLTLEVYSGTVSEELTHHKFGINVGESIAADLPPFILLAGGGLRLTSLDLDNIVEPDLVVFELRQASTQNRHGQPVDKYDRKVKKANKIELDAMANTDVHEVLQRHGAENFGTRESVYGEDNRRRNQYCFTVREENASDCLAVAYLLTRILPLHNQYFGNTHLD